MRGLRFTRSFGKESAIFAGLYESKGDCVVVIDGDLQHPPETIIEMYKYWVEGFEIVEGLKQESKKMNAHFAFSNFFYQVISAAIGE